jgi:protein-S-isoprenylcysteine O-methyltransferase Ste14
MVAVGYVEPSVIPGGWWHLAGLIPIAFGGGLLLLAARQFSKAETNIVPLTRSTALVTDGMFSLTRNPMYLGMTSALVGTAVLLNGYLPWLVILPFVLVIRLRFIRHEEPLMEETFGEDYLAYISRVRRWL